MSVLLPVTDYLSATPQMLDWGGSLIPFLGGDEQRINRLGSRMSLTMTVEIIGEKEGRQFLQRLMRAKSEGAMVAWPQSGIDVGNPGLAKVDGVVTGGTSLPLKDLVPFYAIREGQPLSILIGGRRYLHFADAQVVADASGDATVVVTPMLRKPCAGDEAVEIANPLIEGALDGDAVAWQIAAYGNEPFTLTIREMR